MRNRTHSERIACMTGRKHILEIASGDCIFGIRIGEAYKVDLSGDSRIAFALRGVF